MLLRKPRVPTEVWNDLDGELVHLFKVLRDPAGAEALSRACGLTPFAREEFDLSYEETDNQVERARRFIVRSFFGYGSKACISHAKNGFRCLRAGENSPAVDWSRYPEALQSAARRMLGVVIEHKPALDIIRRFDRQDTLFYLDPPYVQGLRNLEQGIYRHEMTDDEHSELAANLQKIKGMAVVSGYRCALYDKLYSGWRRLDCRAYADKASPRTESLWISPKAQAATQGKLLEVR